MLLPPYDKNHFCVLFAIDTKINIIGTSSKTPTTVAKAAPDARPKRDIATATASSKKLLAPNNWGDIFWYFFCF